MSDDQDWRLEAEVERGGDGHGALDRLVGAARPAARGAATDAEAVVAEDVAVTHDGDKLFVYAATRPALEAARDSVRRALERDGLAASMRESRWDPALGEWLQVDPPLTAAEVSDREAAERDEATVETQTMVSSVGRAVRSSFEEAMRSSADQLGLRCEVVEHRHLLTTQVAFTVTGPRHRLKEFRDTLILEAGTTIRADGFGTGFV
jgi:hypothetical protein